MKRKGRRTFTKKGRKITTKAKKIPIKLTEDINIIPTLFSKLDIPASLLLLTYKNGKPIFDNKSKDLVYQFIQWYENNPTEAVDFVKNKKWASFDDLYWSLPIFDSVRNWKTEEENTYFNSADIQEGVLVCRKPGCDSRKIRYMGGTGTSGDEGLRSHFKCVLCNFPFTM